MEVFLRVCQPSPFLLFGVERLHSELQCDGHAGLSSNSSLTTMLSRSLVHCCHRAGSNLDPPQEWWLAASAGPRGAAVTLGHPPPPDGTPQGSAIPSVGSQQVWVLCSIQQASGAFVVRQGHLENAASSLGQSDSHLAALFVSLGCADVLFLLYI